MSQPAELAEAVECTLHAPSVFNTQPWLWRLGPGVVELHADCTRHLAAPTRTVGICCSAAAPRCITCGWPWPPGHHRAGGAAARSGKSRSPGHRPRPPRHRRCAGRRAGCQYRTPAHRSAPDESPAGALTPHRNRCHAGLPGRCGPSWGDGSAAATPHHRSG